MEKQILTASLKSRDNWLSLEKLLQDGDLSSLGGVIYEAVSQYYRNDQTAEHVDRDLLEATLLHSHPDHTEQIQTALSDMPDVSGINLVEHMVDIRKRAVSAKLASALDLNKGAEEVKALMHEYTELDEVGLVEQEEELAERVFCGASVAELAEKFSAENVIPIYPKQLGALFGGGAIRGDHALIFAPPECGKSAVAINMACGMAAHGYKVLYIGNEDPAERMVMRMISRLSGMVQSDVQVNTQEAEERAHKRGYSNIIFVELAPGSTDDVKRLCREHKPDVCIVDQLSNLSLSGAKAQPGKTELLEKLAYELRMFYKKEKIFGLSLSQASESAIGKLMLDIQDVFYSNIAVQGQVDIMIGIGMNSDYEAQRRRYLNVVKNKVTGVHNGITVTISPLLSKITAN